MHWFWDRQDSQLSRTFRALALHRVRNHANNRVGEPMLGFEIDDVSDANNDDENSERAHLFCSLDASNFGSEPAHDPVYSKGQILPYTLAGPHGKL